MRGFEKVSWSDRISNEVVLKILNEETCLIEAITRRKKNWIGHVLRGDGLLWDVLEGEIVQNKWTGKPREGTINDLKKATSNAKIKKKKSVSKDGAGDKEEREEERRE